MKQTRLTDRIEPLTKDCNGMTLTVDPRIELLAIVQRLAGSKMVQSDSIGYSDAIDAWFGEFAGHPVVGKMKELEGRDFDHDAPVHFMLLYDGVPLENKAFRYEKFVAVSQEARLQHIGSADEFETWIDGMNDFVERSRFAEFFREQMSFYRKRLDLVERKLRGVSVCRDDYGLVRLSIGRFHVCRLAADCDGRVRPLRGGWR